MLLKILFLGLTLFIIFLMRIKKPYRITYEKTDDNYPHRKRIFILALFLTFLFHYIYPEH